MKGLAHRLLVLGTALVWCAVSVQAQQRQRPAEPATVRPPAELPVGLQHPLLLEDAGWKTPPAAPLSPIGVLSPADVLRRIGYIYGLQAEVITAQAEEDHDEASTLMSTAMAELTLLVDQPGMMDDPRFRELYRTLVIEYENIYGPSDTLVVPYGEIFAFRAAMFAALNDVEEPLLEGVVMPALPPMATTVPMTMNRLVESTITYLLKAPDRHVTHWLSRSETYLPMIEQIFQEEGVPDELKYLAMIESGLNPRARSWARAVGMWQFIAATGRAYDLEVNSWVDERMDPEKATRAAARHLRDLYKRYGDWHVALAGYNCSPRCINRARRAAQEQGVLKPTFWDMYPYLPRETRNYVPMFIAAALVTSNPAAFGLPPGKPGPRYAYHYVPVHGMVNLDDIATMAGTDGTTIRALNPELRRSSLPPSKGPYYVRIPLGTYNQFVAKYAALPGEKKQSSASYTVRRGDTLGKIARKYGVSVAALKRGNNLSSNTIQVGQHLVVPVPLYDGNEPQVTLADAESMTVQYRSHVRRPIAAAQALVRPPPAVTPTPVVKASDTAAGNTAGNTTTARTTPSPSGETRVTYKVRRGDTLGKIAGRYGVSVTKLKSWNGLSSSRIQVGQSLSIYADNPNPPASSAPEKETYKVRSGDTLSGIAGRYGVSVRDLQGWNNLRGTKIRVGQRLTVYPGSKASTQQVITYRVRQGDTLSTIARRYGVSVTKLKSWNGLSSSRIKAGQRLKIYN